MQALGYVPLRVVWAAADSVSSPVALGSVIPLGTSLGSEPYIEGSNIPLSNVMLFKYKRKKKALSFSLVYVFEQLKQWMAAVLDVA